MQIVSRYQHLIDLRLGAMLSCHDWTYWMLTTVDSLHS